MPEVTWSKRWGRLERRLKWLSQILITASMFADKFLRDKPWLPILMLGVLGGAGLVVSLILKAPSTETNPGRSAARALAFLVGCALLTIGFFAGALHDMFLAIGAAI